MKRIWLRRQSRRSRPAGPDVPSASRRSRRARRFGAGSGRRGGRLADRRRLAFRRCSGWSPRLAVHWEWQRLIGGSAALVAVFRRRPGALRRRRPLSDAAGRTGFRLLPLAAAFCAWAAGPGCALWGGAGLFYAGGLLLATLTLRHAPFFGFCAIGWLFAVVWGTDVCAYFGGRLIGGPKLAPPFRPARPGRAFWSASSAARLRRARRAFLAQCAGAAVAALPARPRRRRAGAGGRSVRILDQAPFQRQGFEPSHSRPRRLHGPARRLYRGRDFRGLVRPCARSAERGGRFVLLAKDST